MEKDIFLINKIEEIKNKNEKRIFCLEEKFNNLGNDFNKLIDSYNNALYTNETERNNNIDIFSLQQYFLDYLNNERDNSMEYLNNEFNKLIDIINQKNTNSEGNENIKKLLTIIKKEFVEKSKEINNKNDESELQSKEMDNKIKTQMFEQFENINNRIMNEILVDNEGKDQIIKYTQKYLLEIKNQMKIEKLQR